MADRELVGTEKGYRVELTDKEYRVLRDSWEDICEEVSDEGYGFYLDSAFSLYAHCGTLEVYANDGDMSFENALESLLFLAETDGCY